MVSIRDFFVEMGVAAENRCAELGVETRSLLDKRGRCDQIESHLQSYAQDGTLTKGEIDQLLGEIRGAGLDAGALEGLLMTLRGQDGCLRDDNMTTFRNAVSDKMSKVQGDLRDKLFETNSEASSKSADAREFLADAGSYRKKEHDAYMSVINNIK